MTPTEAKKFFKDRCAELGLDCDHLCKLGAGSSNHATTFIYSCKHRTREKSQLFAVKYFEQEDIYIAWNLREPKAKTKCSFRLAKHKVASLKPGQVLAVGKGIEYPSWDTENVFAFRPDTVVRFLKTRVIPQT